MAKEISEADVRALLRRYGRQNFDTSQEAAAYFGVSPATFSRWVNGSYPLTQQACEPLGITVETVKVRKFYKAK